jgi:hypothetical protein
MYRLLNIVDNTKLYTFNQLNRLKGNNIKCGFIDTAMILLPYNLYTTETWILDKYEADGYYIEECYNKNGDIHIFINNDLCYYNKLT